MFRAVATHGLALALCAIAVSGCFLAKGWVPHFRDMNAKLDRFPIPPEYTLLDTYQFGGKPVFWGDYPVVHRTYRSPHSFEETCAEIEALARDHVTVNGCDRAEFGKRCSCWWRKHAGVIPKSFGEWTYAGGFVASEMPEATEGKGKFVRVSLMLRDD